MRRATPGPNRRLALTVVTWIALASAAPAAAAPPTTLVDEDVDLTEKSRAGADDATFGPVLVVEHIHVVGNVSTAARLILRALPIRPGDALRAGDPRFLKARFKVLALGYFRTVALKLRKGSSRGRVVLTVIVEERGTVILNRLNFGSSAAQPWWLGLDLSERNFLGTGIGLGGGFVYTAKGDIQNANDQWAIELRLDDPSILGTPFGAHGALLHTEASEAYRTAGSYSDGSNENFAAFPYDRTGIKGGLSLDVTPLARLTLDGRFERVRAELPTAPTRTLDDGTSSAVDLYLRPGTSRVASISLGFDRDTRADPVLPFNGDRLVVFAEIGTTWLGGSYNFGTALARYEHWWPVRSVRHVVSVHMTGGVVLGDAPLFDRLHVSDLNSLLPPRILGLVMSRRPSPDFLGTAGEEASYGEFGGSAEVQYTYRLFRRRKHIYGGDLFVGAGLWGLARRSRDLYVRDRSVYQSLPVGLLLDAGLRIDTQIGIFELTFANAFGRVPL